MYTELTLRVCHCQYFTKAVFMSQILSACHPDRERMIPRLMVACAGRICEAAYRKA